MGKPFCALLLYTLAWEHLLPMPQTETVIAAWSMLVIAVLIMGVWFSENLVRGRKRRQRIAPKGRRSFFDTLFEEGG